MQKRGDQVAEHPVQLAVEYKGKSYGGIFSVSGTLMIARIPGISSVSREVGDQPVEPLARTLLQQILEQADAAGELE